MASPVATSAAMRRLQRDLQNLQKSRNPQLLVSPSSRSMLNWHFVLHSLPEDTPYHGGCYHGKLIFPPEYPNAPPSILMVTPNGRLDVNKRLCLSMTDFHPESWNPAWSVETILVGLLSFMVSGDEATALGAIKESPEKRRTFAQDSWSFNAKDEDFRELFPEMLQPPASSSSSQENAATSADTTKSSSDNEETAINASPDDAIVTEETGTISLPNASEPADVVDEAPVVEARNSDAASEEARPECWICQDGTSEEPLIQPCDCRGTMSGVHASCVEAWIRHHRQNAVNDAPPRCSVCHQQYRGSERRPGPVQFARHLCGDCTKQFFRSAVLVGLLTGYQAASQNEVVDDGPPLALPLRIFLIALFWLVAAHKIVVLTVSLPLNRPPPAQECARRFFVSDFRQLVLHISEAVAAVFFLAFCVIINSLPFNYFWPVAVFALVPVTKLCGIRQPSLTCVKRAFICIGIVIMAPFLLLWQMGKFMYQNPRRVVNPMDGPPHMVVAVASIVISIVCKSNMPLIILWGAHAVLLALSLIERSFVKRLRWNEGHAWWFIMQLSIIAAYNANILAEFPEGLGGRQYSGYWVLGVSLLWMFLQCGLCLSVNWALCMRYYRTWQNRHGVFTLNAAESSQGDDNRGPLV